MLFFCAVATTISILTMWFLARIFMKDKSIIGEFVQASYRSSAAVLWSGIYLKYLFRYGNGSIDD
mgnify:CR=1 FL=1